MINSDSGLLPQTRRFLSSECKPAEGQGVFLVYVCGSEICVTFCPMYLLFVLSLPTLTFGGRFFTVRFPPSRNRRQRLPGALCSFAARTFSSYSSSSLRKGTAMTFTSLSSALQGQVGQSGSAFSLDPLLRHSQIVLKKYG